jgi:hypothetical protein
LLYDTHVAEAAGFSEKEGRGPTLARALLAAGVITLFADALSPRNRTFRETRIPTDAL